jgi:hypothetical protein
VREPHTLDLVKRGQREIILKRSYRLHSETDG